MGKSAGLWLTALVLTLVSAAWQRRTGPSYPVKGTVSLGGAEIALRLERSHGGLGDLPVRIPAPDAAIRGEVGWRRFPGGERFSLTPLVRTGESLEAALPHQPPAGKIEYQVHLIRGGESAVFPPRPAIARFRGEVPAPVLLAHVLLMFLGMLLSVRAGLEALRREGSPARLALATLVVLCAGGFALGPIVQKAAFGAWWTGVPFGYDLTDNKTVLAAAAWLIAAWRSRAGSWGRPAVVSAAVITLVVFAIPHSVWGSELNWEELGRAQA